MKNNIRKSVGRWLALAMTAIMVFAMTTTVMAAEYTITINGGEKNTYSLYQIATYDVSTLNGQTVYTNIKVNSAYSSVINDSTLATIVAYGSNTDEAAALAVSLKALTGSDSPFASGVTSGSVSNVPSGYYLLVETAHDDSDPSTATKYCLINVEDKDVAVNLKNSTPDLTKKIILEGTTDTLVDANVAAVGDTITYQLDTAIPTYSSDANADKLTFTITDTMSSGLTYGSITSVKVGGTTYSEAADTYSVEEKDGVVTISFTGLFIKAHMGDAVVVVLTAELNDSASIGSDGNPNSATLKYTNNWDTGSTSDTKEDSVITYSGVIEILKAKEGDVTTTLSGAQFTIYKKLDEAATGSTTIEVDGVNINVISVGTITTGADGSGKLTGLDEGIYYAVETVAPTGYSIDATPLLLDLTVESSSSITLESSGDQITTNGNSDTKDSYKVTWKIGGNEGAKTITNKAGTILPGTGGIGTTLFTLGGLALVILAAFMFIAYTKKQRRQA